MKRNRIIFFEILLERGHLGDLDVDGRVILILSFEK